MKYLTLPLLIALPLLLTQCSIDGSATSITPAEILRATEGTTTREKALATEILIALNAYRTSEGKKAITRSSKIDALAQVKSTSMVASNNLTVGNTSAVQKASGFTKVGQAVASFGDRDGTAGKFINHWKTTQNELILGDWSKAGIGVKINTEELVYTTLTLGGLSNRFDLNEPLLIPATGF